MAKQRPTVAKLERERDKKMKAQAKREKRLAAAEEPDDDATAAEPQREEDQQAVLAALAALHERMEAGQISLDDFDVQLAKLRERLQVD